MLNKDFIEDPHISMQATAVLTYLLSKPDNWRVYENDIANHFTNGKYAVRTAIQELISTGYMIRAQARTNGGQFDGYDYQVSEKPINSTHPTVCEKPENGKPQSTNNELSNDLDNLWERHKFNRGERSNLNDVNALNH